MKEIGAECLRGVLIGKDVSENVFKDAENKNIFCFKYSFRNIDVTKKYKFNELLSLLVISKPSWK